MDGILIVDKPAGWTSHDVVSRSRRLLRERRIGHTGTLDPFATGALVLVVGRATRLVQFLAGAEKEYEATVRVGYATDTGDLTGARRGEISPCRQWNREELDSALMDFRGEIEQLPPMYSAKKVQGKKLYELARRGEEVDRKPVRVEIHELEWNWSGEPLQRRNEDGSCDLPLRVVCSAGTYVRTLAESIGERLGAAAHLAALRRTRAGSFHISHALTMDVLQERSADRENLHLVSMDVALSHLPATHLTSDESRSVLHGVAVGAHERSQDMRDGTWVRLRDDEGELLAVGIFDARREVFRPRVTLAVAQK